MTVADAKYVSVTTFRANGEGVATPTWIVALDDGRVGFWTSSASGKIRRLAANPAVMLQECDARGRIAAGAATVAGTAEVVTEGPRLAEVRAKVRAKYGAMTHLTKLIGRLAQLGKKKMPYGDVAVVITLEV